MRPAFQFSLGTLLAGVLACSAFCALTLSLHALGVVLFFVLLGCGLLGIAIVRRTQRADGPLAGGLSMYTAVNFLAVWYWDKIEWGVPIYLFFILLGPLFCCVVVLALQLAHWSIRFSGLALTGFFLLLGVAVVLNVYAFVIYLSTVDQSVKPPAHPKPLLPPTASISAHRGQALPAAGPCSQAVDIERDLSYPHGMSDRGRGPFVRPGLHEDSS